MEAIAGRNVASILRPDEPLRLAVRGSFEEPKPGSQVKIFFASQPHYQGPLSRDAVDAVVSGRRADSLEHRLAEPAMEELRAALVDFDTALRDLSLLIDDEEQRIKRELRSRPDRCIVVPANAAPMHPAQTRLLVARGELSPGTGTIWSEPHEGGRRHYLVRWSEWPGLKAMVDDRSHMMSERAERVRSWIEAEYASRGLEIFEQD